MSRQKGSFGFGRSMHEFGLTMKVSETAGKSKYTPGTYGARECERRLRQLEQWEEKWDRQHPERH